MKVGVHTYKKLQAINGALSTGDDAGLIAAIETMGLEGILSDELLMLARVSGAVPTVILLATLHVENGFEAIRAKRILAAYQSVLEKALRPELAALGQNNPVVHVVNALIASDPAGLRDCRSRKLSPDWLTAIEIALDFKRPEFARDLTKSFLKLRPTAAELQTVMQSLSRRFDFLPQYVDWSAVAECFTAFEHALRSFATKEAADLQNVMIASALQKAGRSEAAVQRALRVRSGKAALSASLIAAQATCTNGEYERAIEMLERHIDDFIIMHGETESAGAGTVEKQFVNAKADHDDFNVEKAGETLVALQEILAPLNVNPFLVSGTLLGYARHGGFLTHDKDVDVGILSSGAQFDIAARLQRDGRFLFNPRALRGENTNMLAVTHAENRMSIDIFFYNEVDGKYLTGVDSAWGYVQKFGFTPFGLQKIKFCGVDFYAPDDIDLNLTENYGPGWRVPDKNYHSHLASPSTLDKGGLVHMLVGRISIVRELHERRPEKLRRALSDLQPYEGTKYGPSPALREKLLAWLETASATKQGDGDVAAVLQDA